jgi:hypothetical protein
MSIQITYDGGVYEVNFVKRPEWKIFKIILKC